MNEAFNISETVLKMSILCMNISIINFITSIGKDIDQKNTIDLLVEMFPICGCLSLKTLDNEYVIMKNKYAEMYFYSNSNKLQVIITDNEITQFVHSYILNTEDHVNTNGISKVFRTIFGISENISIRCKENNEISIVKNDYKYHEIIYKINFIQSNLFEISFIKNIKNKVGEAEIYVENIEDIIHSF